MLFTKESWSRYKGQTEWIKGPGGPIKHTVCGNEILVFVQNRTIWEDDGLGPCASYGQERVSILQCVTCHGEPEIKPGSPICRESLIEIPTTR